MSEMAELTPSNALQVQSERILLAIDSLVRDQDHALPFLEKPEPIGIVGPRGSGKSTLLQYLFVQAQARGNLITLPVVTPELMSNNESILVAIVSSLVELTLERPEMFGSEVTSSRIGELTQRLLR